MTLWISREYLRETLCSVWPNKINPKGPNLHSFHAPNTIADRIGMCSQCVPLEIIFHLIGRRNNFLKHLFYLTNTYHCSYSMSVTFPKGVPCINLFIIYTVAWHKGVIINSILWRRKLSYQEVEELFHSSTANKWQIWNFNLCNTAPEFMLLLITLWWLLCNTLFGN